MPSDVCSSRSVAKPSLVTRDQRPLHGGLLGAVDATRSAILFIVVFQPLGVWPSALRRVKFQSSCGALDASRVIKDAVSDAVEIGSTTGERDRVFFVLVAQGCIRYACSLPAVRMAGEQSKYEPGEQRRTNGEKDIPRDSHPAKSLH